MKQDFSPIVAQGAIERSTGVVARFLRRSALPPVEPGHQRYLVDADGRITGGGTMSPGEKYWSQARSWAVVDVSAHQVVVPMAVLAPTGEGTFEVLVTVSARVVEDRAAAVVRDRVTSVAEILSPLLAEQAKSALRAQAPTAGPGPDAGGEGAYGLTRQLHEAEDAIRECLMQPQETRLPNWLEAKVLAVEVRFDKSAASHVEALRGQARDHVRQVRETEHDLAVRARVRAELAPYLKDRGDRLVELALANPTTASIQSVVDQMQQADYADRQAMVAILRSSMEHNYVDDLHGVGKTLQAIVEGLHSLDGGAALAAGSRVPAPDELGVGDAHGNGAGAASGDPVADETTIEVEVDPEGASEWRDRREP